MRVLAAVAAAAALAAGCQEPGFQSRDVRCPDAGICPSGFVCGYGDWCYDEEEPDADFSGTYVLTSRNGENGCMVENWTEGAVSTNIPASIVQEGRSIELTIEGTPGFWFGLWTGSNKVSGTVHGITADLAFTGTSTITIETPACEFRLNATGGAVIVDDAFEAHLDMIAVGATCEELMDCRMGLALDGVR